MSPVRWDPDDPRWLTKEADLRVMDANVLRQVGVPDEIIFLATRDRLVDSARSSRSGMYMASEEEPYWEDETVCPHNRRRW